MNQLNTLALAHRFLREEVRPGAFCIDATAGRGRDTALLCRLAGEAGRVLALDIQEEAVAATRALLAREGLHNARVVRDSHAHLADYAAPETVDAIVFNLGWLPGGDHDIRTTGATTIPALEQSLGLLPGKHGVPLPRALAFCAPAGCCPCVSTAAGPAAMGSGTPCLPGWRRWTRPAIPCWSPGLSTAPATRPSRCLFGRTDRSQS